jgi:alkylhydroperoxidase family enzyme
MSWLAVDPLSGSDREAVFDLQPQASAHLIKALELAWSITDPGLLDLCRMAMAQILGCRVELAVADGAKPTDLETWRSSEAFSELERAALAYAEQFAIDQKGITDKQKEEVRRHMSLQELVNFVHAVNVYDGYLRLLTVLDVAPDAAGTANPVRKSQRRTTSKQLERDDAASLPDSGRELLAALTEPRFAEARLAFGAAVARQNGVDEVTTECCRLRNANYQGCRF